MKKLNLKLNGMGEMLTKDQMKKVTGGYTIDCYCSWGGHRTVECYTTEDCISQCWFYC